MKNNRLISLLLTVAMLLAAVPAMAADADYASREVAIYAFVEAVGRDGFSQPPADLSAFSDGEKATNPELMALAVGNGLIRGYEDNTIRPDASITRLEALIILGRCLPELEEKRPSTEFTDVPDWAAEEIDRLYRGEIVNGYGNGRLGSSDNISLEQVNMLTDRVKPAKVSEVSLKDDFYSAVNSDYLSAADLGGRLTVSKFTEVQDEVDRRLNEISNEYLSAYKARGTASTMEDQAAKLYQLAIDAYDADAELEPIKPDLEKITNAAMPRDAWSLCGDFYGDYGFPSFFTLYAPYSVENGKLITASETMEIDVFGTGLSSELWNDAANRKSYASYVTGLLRLLGFDNPENLGSAVAELQIGIDLMPENDPQPGRRESLYSYEDLLEKYGQNNPLCYALLAMEENLKDSRPRAEKIFAIYNTDRMDAVIKKILWTDTSIIQALCAVNYAKGLMRFMPKDFRRLHAEFNRSITGLMTSETAEEYAADIASYVYAECYENSYLKKYGLSSGDKDTLNLLVNDVVNCYKNKLRNSNLLSKDTINTALDKLDKMAMIVAEPTGSYDPRSNYYYIRSDFSLLDVGLDVYDRWGRGLNVAYTNITADYPCYTANASYSHYANRFNIYAGILSQPIYSASYGKEELLGSIGFIIAHEISHAFDKTGSNYTAYGYKNRWWQADDYAAFTARADKLAAVYSAYVTAGGNHINGQLTSDENIADIMAMDCIITLAKQKGLNMDALFRTYAALWAELNSPEYDAYCISFDVHADGKTRVNAVLSNFDEFYETYSITEGDGMYRSPENRIKLI